MRKHEIGMYGGESYMNTFQRFLIPFTLGLREGFDEPYDLGYGMTYDDSPHSLRSRLYDHGANIGQWFGRALDALLGKGASHAA
jgi:hypothetical protein